MELREDHTRHGCSGDNGTTKRHESTDNDWHFATPFVRNEETHGDSDKGTSIKKRKDETGGATDGLDTEIVLIGSHNIDTRHDT